MKNPGRGLTASLRYGTMPAENQNRDIEKGSASMPNYPWPKTIQETFDNTIKEEFSKCMEKLYKANSTGRFSRAEVYTAFLDGITVGMNLVKNIH